MNEETRELVGALAAKLGTTAEQMFDMFVAKQVAQAELLGMCSLIFLGMLIFGAGLSIYGARDYKREAETLWGIFLVSAGAIFGLITFYDFYMHAMVPETLALEELLKSLAALR